MESFDEQVLTQWLPELESASALLVGFSGGLDSTVLLHVLCRLIPADKIQALHVHHGLSPRADDWVAHCVRVCHALGVVLHVERVSVVADGKGLEEAARTQRYLAFTRHLPAGGKLLLAHHRDDQVETILFRLLRGAGPRGLAGMPTRRRLGSGELLRPLLGIERTALEAWARAQGLVWIEDESNIGTDFDRNFLRHRVLPLLASRWPGLDRRLLRSAALCRDGDQLLQEVGEEDLQRLGEKSERLGWSLAVQSLQKLSRVRRANLLRIWLTHRGLPIPGHRQVAAVLDDLLPAREDAMPLVRFGGGEFRRFGERLFLLPCHLSAALDVQELPWEPVAPLKLPDGFVLEAQEGTGGVRLARRGAWHVRFRCGGERCRPVGRRGSRPLKKLLQEYGLEPWLRDRIPLVYVDGELAAVGDLFVCAGFEAGTDEKGIALTWRHAGADGSQAFF